MFNIVKVIYWVFTFNISFVPASYLSKCGARVAPFCFSVLVTSGVLLAAGLCLCTPTPYILYHITFNEDVVNVG